VCPADEVLAVGGWKAAQKANKVQLVGKDYIMRDGEVVYIRFNV
jgi:ribosome-binding ATPase YchF (GTP1/OBG family)